MSHRWDDVRDTPTLVTRAFLEQMGLDNIGGGIHESLLRSYRILGEVKGMLDRGDSPQTVREFIEWAEGRVTVGGRDNR